MKLLRFIWVILTLLPGLVSAQGIVFEKGSWADAVKKAKKEKKLLFLHLDSPKCGACDEVASAAFNSPLIKEKFALHFVSFRTDGTSGIGQELARRLQQECTPASVYLDADENPLVRYCGSTSFDRIYLEKAEEALAKSRQQPLKILADAYAKGDRSSALLRQYIDRLREQDLSNTEPLDAYVMSLPADSLRSGMVLRFIFEQAPVLGSKADSVFRSDYRKVDSLYRAVGWNKAVELNARFTSNSLRKAIKEKNVQLASRTAFFRQRTFTNDVKNGMVARDWVMMSYFRGIKDTLTYLSLASDYYDRHFMTARVDSVQKLDELESQRRMRGEFTGPNGAVTRPSKPGQMISVMAFPNTQRYVGALNQAAMDFQDFTRDPVYLNKALSWSKRTLEYREDGGLMDTYARVLYRLGRKEEALEWQVKAVKKEKERQSPMAASLEKTLAQMKAGTF